MFIGFYFETKILLGFCFGFTVLVLLSILSHCGMCDTVS